MAFLPPEVNQAHTQLARTWRPKIDGVSSPAAGQQPFKYDPARDPYLRKSSSRPIITQARRMGYLSPEVNSGHFRAAQLQQARAGLQEKHGRAPPQRRVYPDASQYEQDEQRGYDGEEQLYDDDERAQEQYNDEGRDSERYGDDIEEREWAHDAAADADRRAHQGRREYEHAAQDKEGRDYARSQQQERQEQRGATHTHHVPEAETPLARTPLRSSIHPEQQQSKPPQQEYRQQQQQYHARPEPALPAAAAPPTSPPAARAPVASPARHSTPARALPPDLAWASPSNSAASVPSAAVADASSAQSIPSGTNDSGDGDMARSPRRQMTPAAAERHAAQARAFEDAQREWASLTAEHAAVAAASTAKQPQPAAASASDFTPFDEPAPAASRSAAAFDAAPVSSGAAAAEPVLESFDSADDYDDDELTGEEEAGSTTDAASEADLYSYYRAAQHNQQQQRHTAGANDRAAYGGAGSNDGYDPLAAEQATIAASGYPLGAASVKRTPTLRPSRRQL